MSDRPQIHLWLMLAAGLLISTPAHGSAQRVGTKLSPLGPGLYAAALDQSTGSTGRALVIEASGGTLGSLIGFGTVYFAHNDCEGEDLVCNLGAAFAAVALGTVGSAAGAYAAGRAFATEPSGIGSALGAIAGAAGAIGVVHLLTEELNVVNGTGPRLASYVVTQGLITALGSRVVRSLQ